MIYKIQTGTGKSNELTVWNCVEQVNLGTYTSLEARSEKLRFAKMISSAKQIIY